MMRVLVAMVLLTSLAQAEVPQAQVSSYEFQGPRRIVRPRMSQRQPSPSFSSAHRSSRPSSPAPVQPFSAGRYLPRLAQRPAPAHLSNWGGTVVSSSDSQHSITTNGPLPRNSVVCIGRGEHFLDQAQVLASGTNTAQIKASGSTPLMPGDWVSLVSVPAPPVQVNYASSGYISRRSTHSYANSYGGNYHPTSSNADPRYQEWLRRGFTLGRVSGGDFRSSNCSSSNTYWNDW